MCRIAGVINAADPFTVVRSMCDAMHRGGPDDQGYYEDAAGKLYLGHRRLSIIDLSSGGHQPMISADGRHVIVLNGEIYNFRALRAG